MQAKVLAKYKPRINTTTLLSDLKHVADRANRAIKYFKSTRHIVVYYEDVMGNSTVRLFNELFDCCPIIMIKEKLAEISCAETEGSSRVSEIAIW